MDGALVLGQFSTEGMRLAELVRIQCVQAEFLRIQLPVAQGLTRHQRFSARMIYSANPKRKRGQKWMLPGPRPSGAV